MTFEQMRYFIEVAHCQNFSKAARNLYISQPNLTKYIANMERELNMKLFERTSRYVKLTEEGKMLFDRTEVLYFQFMRAVEDTQVKSRQKFQQVAIGLSRDEQIPSELFALFHSRNRQDNTTVRYILTQDTYMGLISGLTNKEYDLIISTDRNIRLRNDFSYYPLREFHMILAVPGSHPKATQADLKPSDFQDEPVFVALPNGKDVPHEVVNSVYRNSGAELNLHFMDSPCDLMLNVQIGAGVAIVSNLIDQSKFPDVKFYEYEESRGAMQCVGWRAEDTNPAVQELVELLRGTWKTP